MQDFDFKENDKSISCIFSSTLNNVDKTVEYFKCFLDDRKIDNQFELIYIIREALNNAVIHGNQKNEQLKVECTIGFDKDILSISVTDEGQGFNWRKELHKKQVASTASSGRGIKSMNLMGFDVEYNESGNTLYLTKKIM